MKQNGRQLETVYLKPGELFVGEKPTRVMTVLGSCVSVTFYCRRLELGAICHGALPECRRSKSGTGEPCDDFKYVDSSLNYMLNSFRRRGVSFHEIEVKLFGGADLLASKKESAVGSMNIRKALEMIREKNLHLVAADVGDHFGRKLIFHTHTGDVYLKRLINRAADDGKGRPGLTLKVRRR